MILIDTSVWIAHLCKGAPQATNPEVMDFIEQRALMSRGVGYIEVHLLASVALAGTARLWTLGKRLAAVAADLKLAHNGNGYSNVS